MTREDVKRLVYIPLTEENRFLVFAMDGDSGKLTLKHDLDLPAQPWQLCISPDQRSPLPAGAGRRLQWSPQHSNRPFDGRRDPSRRGRVLESDACYVSTDKTGRFLFAAYLFPGMVTVHPIDTDGAARGPAVDTQLTDLYAHYITTDNSNRFAFVPHVTPTDAIYRFRFDETSGRLTTLRSTQARHPDRTRPTPPCIPSHPGRRVRKRRGRPPASTSTVSDPADGSLEPIQSLSTLPDEAIRRRQQHRHPPGPPFGKSRLRLQSRPRQHRCIQRRPDHRTALTHRPFTDKGVPQGRSTWTPTAASSTPAATTQVELPPTK